MYKYVQLALLEVVSPTTYMTALLSSGYMTKEATLIGFVLKKKAFIKGCRLILKLTQLHYIILSTFKRKHGKAFIFRLDDLYLALTFKHHNTNHLTE